MVFLEWSVKFSKIQLFFIEGFRNVIKKVYNKRNIAFYLMMNVIPFHCSQRHEYGEESRPGFPWRQSACRSAAMPDGAFAYSSWPVGRQLGIILPQNKTYSLEFIQIR